MEEALARFGASGAGYAVGIGLALVGFVVTWYGIWKTKSAAESARDAAKGARDSIVTLDTIKEISAAVQGLAEIKRLVQLQAWALAPGVCALARERLIEARAANVKLSDEARAALLGTITHLSEIEKVIQKALAANLTPTNPTRLYSTVSDQSDKLSELLGALTREVN